jgi:DNA helicase-2/ATP-dependent DNA helicase PcrA
MERRKRYDFGDMIQWILKAFETNKFLLRRYQEQYMYVLVDEFQDTNGAQNQILRFLADYWELPNIFVVGDDDQSIYEFQGARVQNIMDFHKEYNDVKLVVLNENYRSSQKILNSASVLIQKNQIRLVTKINEVDKDLLASRKGVAKSLVLPKIVAYPNSVHEITDIANQIEKLKRKKVPLNEIAVIYAKHRQATSLIKILESKKIAYHTKRRINILEQPMIQNIVSILQYIQREYERPYSGERLLFEMLYIDFFGVSMRDIARLSALMAKRQRKEDSHWRDILTNKKALKKEKLDNVKAIERMMDALLLLVRQRRNVPLPVLVERLINRTGVLHFVANHDDKVWLMQVLTTFLDFVERETLKQPTLNIKGLLSIIDRMKSNRIPLGIQKTMFSREGVQLLTAHSSKGLEFEYVFMLGCVGDFWEASSHSGRNQFSLPDTLTLTQSITEDADEAARRLFYVAMTRAKEHLQISYSKTKKDSKPLKKAKFIDEILAHSDLEIQEKQLKDELLYEAQMQELQETELPKIDSPLDAETLDGLLEGFTLSVSSLSKYLNCPLSFYFENVIRVPSVSSVAAAYGTAVHYALQKAFQKMRSHKEMKFPSTKSFMQDFEWELHRQRAYLSDKQFKDRLAFGQKVLPDYYEHYKDKWYKDEIRVELEIRNVEVLGVPLTGTIDKIEFKRTYELHIVDYKTGKYRPEKVKSPTPKYPNGGDYWRQAVFYKILLENYQNKGWLVLSAMVEYIEPYKNEFKRAKFAPISGEDVAIVKDQIKNSYQEILKHNFFTGCGKPTCEWCNFVKHHEVADRYVGTGDEELDE